MQKQQKSVGSGRNPHTVIPYHILPYLSKGKGEFSVKPALFFRVRIDWREKEGEPMERNLHEPEIYDFRQHDRLWQRVGPGLEPYPETTAEAMPRREELPPAQESLLPGAEPSFWRCWRDTSRRNWRTGGAIWRCPGRHPRGRGRPCGIWRRRRTATPGGSWRPGISSPASPTGPIWCAACSARAVGRRNCGEATMRRRAAA